MSRLVAIVVAATAVVTCGPTDSVIVNLGENPDTLVVAGQSDSIVLANPDTTFGPPDTVILTRVDTLIAPPDSILVTVVDTVEVNVVDTVEINVVDTIVDGTDTTFVTRVDTVFNSSVDTVFSSRVDTLVTVDTVVVSTVDTVVTVDTVIVADTIRVQTRLVATAGSEPLGSGLTIDSGKTATLSVTAQNALDVPSIPSDVTWFSDAPGTASVDNGTVRGVRPGTANIFAIASGLSVTVPTTVLRVSSPPPPPPPPPAGSQSRFYRAHEPGGMTALTNRPFSAIREGWTVEFDGNPETIVSDSEAPHSPSGAMQFNYPAGFTGGGPGGNVGVFFFPRSYDVVYLYLTWKVSANWKEHFSGTNKQFFIGSNNPNPASGAGHNTFFSAQGYGYGPIHFAMNGQNHCCDQPFLRYDPNVGSGALERGQWHEIEVVLTANTPGVRDGRLEVWVDGEKSHDYSNFGPLQAGEGPGFTKFLWSSIWGGLGDTVDNDQWIRLDHVYVSGKN